MGRYSSGGRYDDRYDDRRDRGRGGRFDSVFIDDMKDLIGRMMQDSREDRALIAAVMQALDYRRSDSAAENCEKLYNFIDRFVERNGRRITDELPPRLLEDALDDWLRGVVPRLEDEMRRRDRGRDDRYDDRRDRDRGRSSGGRWDYSTRYNGGRRDRGRDDRYDDRRDRDRERGDTDGYSLGMVEEPAPQKEPRESRSERRYSTPDRDTGTTVRKDHDDVLSGTDRAVEKAPNLPRRELTLEGFGLSRERLDDELVLNLDDLITFDENVFYHGKHAEFEAHASLIHVNREVADVTEALSIADDTIPDEMRKGEYLHVIDYDELALVEIPTAEFEEVRARVREEYTANKQWSVLLKIRGKMSYDSGTALDKFLTTQINAMLLQYFRVDSEYDKRVQIDGLNDLKGLMDGEFGLPHKNIKDWKTLLSARLEDLIDRVFMVDNSYVTVNDSNMGDIVKVKGYNLVVNKVTKVDLGFVEPELKEAWLDQFFKTYTVVRMNRRVAVSNILNSGEVHHNGMAATNTKSVSEQLFWMTFETVDRLCREHHVDRVYFYPGKDITETPQGARFVMYPVDKNGLLNPRLVGTETFCNGEGNGRA